MAVPGMEQCDMSQVGCRAQRCSHFACAHRCELLREQRNRIHTHPLSGSTNNDGVDVRHSEIRRVVRRCGDAQFCSRQRVIDVCQPWEQPANRERGWQPQGDDRRCPGRQATSLRRGTDCRNRPRFSVRSSNPSSQSDQWSLLSVNGRSSADTLDPKRRLAYSA